MSEDVPTQTPTQTQTQPHEAPTMSTSPPPPPPTEPGKGTGTKASRLTFRAPSTISQSTSTSPSTDSTFKPPTLPFLCQKWHVTHSTLPMWKSNRNVTITYTALPSPSSPSSTTTAVDGDIKTTKLDDLVEYQPLNSDKQKTVRGVDTPSPDADASYTWRGRGWLKIATSKWEVLGYGVEHDGGVADESGDGGRKGAGGGGAWMVTYFAKTLFTPAGIDVYSLRREGVSEDLLGRIRREMEMVAEREGGGQGAEEFKKLSGQIFEILRD